KAPDVVGAGLPEIPVEVGGNVARAIAVFVVSVMDVGAARAVCVNWAESCPRAVSTAAVLIAFTSTVGAGVAPTLQLASNSAVTISVNSTLRSDFRTNIVWHASGDDDRCNDGSLVFTRFMLFNYDIDIHAWSKEISSCIF